MNNGTAILTAILVLATTACEPPAPAPPGPPEDVLTEMDLEYVDGGENATEGLPDATEAMSVDTTAVLASYSTRYAVLGAKESRAKNVELAASRLDGTAIYSGDSLSFNTLVGPRSKEEGFLVAPVIWDGELALDIGGGVCQVSSTLHAAVLKSGIKPTFRRPHSRFSNYIPPGLDATVAYSPGCGDLTNTARDGGTPECWSVDFTFDNPFTFPIGILVAVRDVKKGVRELKVTIVGGKPAGDVVISHSISRKGPFLQEFRRGRRLKDDAIRKVQEGRKGNWVRTTVRIDGPERYGTQSSNSILYKSYYKPVNEIWEVGPEYDMNGPPPWEPLEESEFDAGAPDAGQTDAGN